MPGKKFRFSLQKVLELRRHQTKRAHQALVEAEQELKVKEAQLKEAREHLAQCRRAAVEAEGLRPAELRQAEIFRQQVRQDVKQAREAVEACQGRVKEARAELKEWRQAEEALEELHDREKEQHAEEQAKAETAFFDEQAVLRHSRTNDDTSLLSQPI